MIEEAWSIITDPGHVLAEFTFIAIEGLLLTPVISWALKRHDRNKHGAKVE